MKVLAVLFTLTVDREAQILSIVVVLTVPAREKVTAVFRKATAVYASYTPVGIEGEYGPSDLVQANSDGDAQTPKLLNGEQ
jgi:hypothetical protein